MLTKEETDFMAYWEKNRERRKKVFRQLSVGLPLGSLIVAMILVNALSGWYNRAMMTINVNTSLVIVLLIASLLIVAFIVVFSVKHRWEMDEQRYQELKAKKP
jgi:Ca2+/Na+ antiporter